VIGQLYLTIYSVENLGAEVGWVFHPDFQGKGYATEAATALLELAFGELGMHRVRAELDPLNAASIALCHRLGMREEAHFVKDVWLRGKWDDSGIYAVLEDEWAARKA
jgi:aminoglycoside 6'-N-acetyltransferase